MELRVRNAGLRKVKVTDLTDAPWNHRSHPDAQAAALDGAIDELGFYGFPDVFEAADGSLVLIDGHLRKARLIARYGAESEIEVNVTDFDEAEAKKANLTKDPLAAMAESNVSALDALYKEVEVANQPLKRMLADLAAQAGVYQVNQQSGVDDPLEHWRGMPEFEQADLTAWKTIHVHFKNREAYEEFSRLINQTLTDKTRSVWYPPAEIGRYADKRYADYA